MTLKLPCSLPLALLLGALLSSCDPVPGEWAFSYEAQEAGRETLLDLSFLNEDEAGEHGFIRLSDDGSSFVRGDDREIRFWPVNGGSATRNMNDEQLAQHARFLATMGVNMNRWHGSINPKGKDSDGRESELFELDTAEVEQIWRFVAAMKKEGIYSTISPFWAHNGHMGGWVPEGWGIEGYQGKDALWAVMYFNPRLRAAYKQWVRYLYTEVNPYTGLALKDDPAVGLIQVKNEDGVFFWTFSMIRPELKAVICRQFAQWLTATYGSPETAMRRWEGTALPADDPGGTKGQPSLDLYPIWELTQPAAGGKARRMADQVRFMAESQREFYRDIHDHYRNELGCRQLINANNWKTADPARMNDLERWTNMACEVPAVNRYYGPGHAGENSGWRIDPGHHYQGNSVLKNPHRLPINSKQVAGAPMLVTESGWHYPHRYQSEAPALISAYQGLSGHDAFYWFAITSVDYMEDPYFEFTRDSLGRRAMHRWTQSTPGGIAQFPAYALAYRRGYFRKGETVVREHRTMEELWNMASPLLTEEASFDPNRDLLGPDANAGQGDANGNASPVLSPLSYLAGPVEVIYGSDAVDLIHPALDSLVDEEAGRVTSITGQQRWDYRKGQFFFSAPCIAGGSGFMEKGRTYRSGPLHFITWNDYLTLSAVSLDGEALESSKEVLIQAGTQYHPTGWVETPAEYVLNQDTLQGFRIEDTGRMPWLAEETLARIKLENPHLNRAYLLHTNGQVAERLALKQKGGRLEMELPRQTLYLVLKAE